MEECPCFEDAVAFLSVVAGIMIREAWTPAGFATATYGYDWSTPAEFGKWSAAVLAKLLVGAFFLRFSYFDSPEGELFPA